MPRPQLRLIQGGRLSRLPAPRVPLPAPWRETIELCFQSVPWNDVAFLLMLRSESSLTEFQRDRLARTWRKVGKFAYFASDDGDAA
jgi:hypothetical protein